MCWLCCRRLVHREYRDNHILFELECNSHIRSVMQLMTCLVNGCLIQIAAHPGLYVVFLVYSLCKLSYCISGNLQLNFFHSLIFRTFFMSVLISCVNMISKPSSFKVYNLFYNFLSFLPVFRPLMLFDNTVICIVGCSCLRLGADQVWLIYCFRIIALS